MTKDQPQQLAAAVSRATEAGKVAAAAAADDGGSANLDRVYLCDLKGIREKTLLGAGIAGYMKSAGARIGLNVALVAGLLSCWELSGGIDGCVSIQRQHHSVALLQTILDRLCEVTLLWAGLASTVYFCALQTANSYPPRSMK
ncbi:hypothetical protein [Pseudomonas orientalis]|uniref:Uncharacterized protein n=1 Tax=Pseudomonas orientalis TaxID=76758 RepID=A0A2L0RXP0_9PSED|nr:hypothetical protein [Pseudomonas orientalis]AUZ46867.1 hypothetical protein BOP93_15080 [Pseudomonas orientalis]